MEECIAPIRSEWIELRDDRGKLLARLQPQQWLLEIRRNHQTTIFDLHLFLIYALYPNSPKETRKEDE